MDQIATADDRLADDRFHRVGPLLRHNAGRMAHAAAKRARLLAALAAAAEQDRPCPSNAELMPLTGAQSHGDVYCMLIKLEQDGALRLELRRGGRGRRATILATGKRTAWSTPAGATLGASEGPLVDDGRMGLALAASGQRFADATRAERERFRRATPPSAALPRREDLRSYVGCSAATCALYGDPK